MLSINNCINCWSALAMSLSVYQSDLNCSPRVAPRGLVSPDLSLRWEVSEWSECQSDCSGLKTREVDCVTDEAGEKVGVSESECAGTPPPSALPCTRNTAPLCTASPVKTFLNYGLLIPFLVILILAIIRKSQSLSHSVTQCAECKVVSVS